MESPEFPLVSLVIACRNEAGFIEQCLASIQAQDYPAESLEILVVDGMSDDGTPDRVRQLAEEDRRILLRENPRRLTPFAMNIGLQEASGDVRVLVNAHSILAPDFVRRTVDALHRSGADGVGGTLQTRVVEETAEALSIPAAADSPFGSGGNRYRNRSDAGFIRDTLPFCAYPLATFEKFGWIDESLIRDQDEEFNYRILRGGGKIYYDPAIRSTLYIRPDLARLFRQHYQYGYFKPLVMCKVGGLLTWRQMVPGIFVAALLLTGSGSLFCRTARRLFLSILALYGIVGGFFAQRAAEKAGRPELTGRILLAFFTLHVSYGLGTLRGSWDFILCRRERVAGTDLALTR